MASIDGIARGRNESGAEVRGAGNGQFGLSLLRRTESTIERPRRDCWPASAHRRPSVFARFLRVATSCLVFGVVLHLLLPNIRRFPLLKVMLVRSYIGKAARALGKERKKTSPWRRPISCRSFHHCFAISTSKTHEYGISLHAPTLIFVQVHSNTASQGQIRGWAILSSMSRA